MAGGAAPVRHVLAAADHQRVLIVLDRETRHIGPDLNDRTTKLMFLNKLMKRIRLAAR